MSNTNDNETLIILIYSISLLFVFDLETIGKNST